MAFPVPTLCYKKAAVCKDCLLGTCLGNPRYRGCLQRTTRQWCRHMVPLVGRARAISLPLTQPSYWKFWNTWSGIHKNRIIKKSEFPNIGDKRSKYSISTMWNTIQPLKIMPWSSIYWGCRDPHSHILPWTVHVGITPYRLHTQNR